MKHANSAPQAQPSHNRILLLSVLCALAVLALLLGGVTAAWLAITRTPTATNLQLSVIADNRLEVAPDVGGAPGEWDVTLDLSAVLDGTSSLRACTWSQSNGAFFAMTYDEDGRSQGATLRLSDEANANGAQDSYYTWADFWVRGTSAGRVALSAQGLAVDETTTGTGTYLIGSPVRNGSAVQHQNTAAGLETALRVGLLCQPVDTATGALQGASRFVVYEPNADRHVDSEVSGILATPSIDGTSELVPEQNLLRQTASRWNDTAAPTAEALVEAGEFTSGTELFAVGPSTVQKVRLYLWVEGQDIDAVDDAMGAETAILVNIQLESISDINSGIVRD